MQLRLRLYRSKRDAMKKNPNLFISTTRLCLRNLPKNFTEQEVKTLISHYLEEWKHTLKEEELK